jgi:hypothetical protein
VSDAKPRDRCKQDARFPPLKVGLAYQKTAFSSSDDNGRWKRQATRGITVSIDEGLAIEASDFARMVPPRDIEEGMSAWHRTATKPCFFLPPAPERIRISGWRLGAAFSQNLNI